MDDSGISCIGLVILVAIVWWGYNHFFNKTWTAVYYPNAENLDYFMSQEVDSLEECRDWVSVQAQIQGNYNYDYECGTNCKLEQDYMGRYYRCDESFQ